MKKTIVSLLFAVVILCGMGGAAFSGDFGSGSGTAEDSSASIFTLTNLNTQYTMPIIQDDVLLGNLYAGEFGIDIDGVSYGSFCIELDMPIWMNRQYEAVVTKLPPTAPWCEISAILNKYDATDGYSGAAMQLAIWKLIYADSNVYSSNTYVEGMASDILAEVEGNCPLMCSDDTVLSVDAAVNADNEVLVAVELEQDGLPVSGQEIGLEISAGSIVEPEDGFVTDFDGRLEVVVEVPDGVTSFTVTASAEGFALKHIDLGDIQNQVMLDAGDSCSFSASDTYELTVGYGNPHTIGFWKHQVKSSSGCGCHHVCHHGWGHGWGQHHGCNNSCDNGTQVPRSLIQSWLPITVFNYRYRTIKDLENALWIGHANMYQRARQQCLATKLNVAYGELTLSSWVDTNTDGVGDMTVKTALETAERYYFSGNPWAAKDICDNINNL